MAETRKRWFVKIVMLLAFFAFFGISMAPLVSGIFQGGQTSSTADASAPIARKAELESQAKGYELVLQREPDNQTALKGLLEARLALNDVKNVVEPLEKLAKLNPQETQYAILLAQAKQQNNDFEGAAQTYRTVLATKPGEILALQGLVGLLINQKRPEAAVGLLQDTLKSATQANQVQAGSIDTTSVQILLAGVYADQKRYDEAIAAYDEAAKTSKQDFRPVYGKAVVLKEQGKTEEAKTLFNKAAELAPAKYRDKIKETATAGAPGSIPTAPTTAPAAAPTTAPNAPSGITLPTTPPASETAPSSPIPSKSP